MGISIIGIIGTFPIVIVFVLCFGLTLRSYLKNPNRAKLFFMISFISIALIYLIWGLRVLLIPQFEANPKVLYPFWAFNYAIGGLALIALDFAVINMLEKDDSTFFKIVKILILASYITVLILLIAGFEVKLTIFMDVSDLLIANIFVYVYFTILILFYIFFPNAIFINYLLKSPSKTTFAYKRVRIVELGILLFSIGIALDGARIPSNIGILIARIILLIGGVIMVKGFLMKPTSE